MTEPVDGAARDAWGPHRRSTTTAHRLEHAGFRTIAALARALPERLTFRLGEALGALAGGPLGLRRRDVDANLARAFPHRSPEWRAEVARASFRHLGRETMAILRFSGRGSELVDRTEVVGLERLRASLAEGKGAVLVAGHLGNWELGGAILSAHGIPIDAVAIRQNNPLIDAEFFRTRTRFGNRLIEKAKAPRHVIRSLREGRAVALIADQNATRGGIFVDFFGVPAATARGPALFALRAGAPLWIVTPLAVRDRRPGDPLYRVVMEEVHAERTGDLDEDVRRLTQAHTRALEASVEAAPEQYFWQHRRWKTRPADEGGEEPRTA
jgi:Kdo2-lipid IVA lauroyltransferase/acyltransferase